MGKKTKVTLIGLLSLVVVFVVSYLLLRGNNVAVLNPKGTIAESQFDLMVFTSLLSLIVVVPVFALTVFVTWKYRAGNKKATYKPGHDSDKVAEAIWWLVPTVLISILAVITWVSTHKLDPYRPIESNVKPVQIEVIALDWKWLFIYPEHNIATVNFMQVPTGTPINFKITADAPMNSFWIPQLGGQVYAMAGMQTKLHLQADEPGEYKGTSANLSGEGFAGMRFTVKASSKDEFKAWLEQVRQSPKHLTTDEYANLVKKSKNNPQTLYATRDPKLYETVIMKYMMPGMRESTQPTNPDDNPGQGSQDSHGHGPHDHSHDPAPYDHSNNEGT